MIQVHPKCAMQKIGCYQGVVLTRWGGGGDDGGIIVGNAQRGAIKTTSQLKSKP